MNLTITIATIAIFAISCLLFVRGILHGLYYKGTTIEIGKFIKISTEQEKCEKALKPDTRE